MLSWGESNGMDFNGVLEGGKIFIYLVYKANVNFSLRGFVYE